MVRLDCGGTLVNVRVRAVVLLSAFAIPLLFPVTSYALSVDPLLDTVRSVAKLHESENTPSRDNGRGSNKHEDKAPVVSPSSDNAAATAGQSAVTPAAVSEPAIAAEPLDQLPAMDNSEMLPQVVRIHHPVSALTVSRTVLGGTTTDSITPLQASKHGWKLFNIAWYWWLLSGLAAFYGGRRIIQSRRLALNVLGSKGA